MKKATKLGVTAVLVLATLAGAACASKKEGAELAGRWVGKVQLDDAELAKSAPANTSADDLNQMKKMAESMTTTLELNSDGTYTMSMMGMDVKDTWTLDGNTLTLASSGSSFSSHTENGKTTSTTTPDKKPLTLTVSDDKKSITETMPGQKNSKIVFTRQDTY